MAATSITFSLGGTAGGLPQACRIKFGIKPFDVSWRDRLVALSWMNLFLLYLSATPYFVIFSLGPAIFDGFDKKHSLPGCTSTLILFLNLSIKSEFFLSTDSSLTAVLFLKCTLCHLVFRYLLVCKDLE